jgi:hypothetical protein
MTELRTSKQGRGNRRVTKHGCTLFVRGAREISHAVRAYKVAQWSEAALTATSEAEVFRIWGVSASYCAHKLRLPIDDGDYSDARVLREMLFYAHCPADAAKIRKDDEITYGRALPVLALATVKLGKQVRAFIAAASLPTIPCSTESVAPSPELPASRSPSFWRRVMVFVRGAAVALFDVTREGLPLCCCVP